MTGRLSVGLNVYGDLCMLHKPGGVPVSAKTLRVFIQMAQQRVKDCLEIIRYFLSQQ